MADHDAPPRKFLGGIDMPAAEIDALAANARFRHRSLRAEIRLLVRRALHEYALDAIHNAPEEIEGRGFDLDEDRDRLQDELDRLTHEMFDRPRTPTLASWI